MKNTSFHPIRALSELFAVAHRRCRAKKIKHALDLAAKILGTTESKGDTEDLCNVALFLDRAKDTQEYDKIADIPGIAIRMGKLKKKCSENLAQMHAHCPNYAGFSRGRHEDPEDKEEAR